MQKARDAAAGLDTAGYVSGYRGSPLGGVDQAMWRAQAQLTAADVKFEPGLNEDLAATALWGTQQVDLHGEGRVRGRLRPLVRQGPRRRPLRRRLPPRQHGRHRGARRRASPASATTTPARARPLLHQSRVRAGRRDDADARPGRRAGDPRLRPLGWALSRYTGVLGRPQGVKDTVEVTGVVDGRPAPR